MDAASSVAGPFSNQSPLWLVEFRANADRRWRIGSLVNFHSTPKICHLAWVLFVRSKGRGVARSQCSKKCGFIFEIVPHFLVISNFKVQFLRKITY